MFKLKERKAKKEQLANQKKYAEVLQSGAIFIDFIQKDIANSKTTLNRSQRRRFDKSIKNGLIDKEIVEHYSNKVEQVLFLIENQKEIKKQSRKKAMAMGGKAKPKQ